MQKQKLNYAGARPRLFQKFCHRREEGGAEERKREQLEEGIKERGKAAILISKKWTIYFLTGLLFVPVVDVGPSSLVGRAVL